MDIADVARRAGLPPSTLRYYEEKGLIASTGRHGLRRQYDESVPARLALIGLVRAAGFTLDQIVRLLPGGSGSLDREMLTARADELDRTVAELTALSDSLRHAAACPAPSHTECSSFQRIVRAEAARPTRRRAFPIETRHP
ncbi:helix-turn-helix domain-containing protein [Cryptosporangium sp. NPDC051539]|uniref:helix-turn-helix domain-containing protein n=1 Tax=Cryptosporangium sp. NPDC051539 TaxID=3363962 RepID=UPI0037A2BB15